MKESVLTEFEKLIKVINESNRDLDEVILFKSSCFNTSAGEYSVDIKSSIFHSTDFEAIYSLVAKYRCHLFICTYKDFVVLDIQ